jgi:PKD repeat protein
MPKVHTPIKVLCVLVVVLLVGVMGVVVDAGAQPFVGKPPLSYHGGPVMGTTGNPGQVTVVPIYWDPASTMGASYENVITGFVQNVALASGAQTNVFSTLLQYGIDYTMSAGTAIVDTGSFPANGCTPDTGNIYTDNSGYTSCLTDAQIQSEIATVLAHNSLTGDLQHLYVVFLPKGVESCLASSNGALNGKCTINNTHSSYYCGYHSNNGSTIYSVMPFPIYSSQTQKTCGSSTNPANTPNNELDADVEVSTLSGQMMGAITDPEGTAWYDRKGHEIDYDCAFRYGSDFNGVSPDGLYNQKINGADYFIQEELSNEDFQAQRSHACVQALDLPIAGFRFSPRSPRPFRLVQFNAKRTKGNISLYSWNFGDSNTGAGQKVTHAYNAPGTYTVTLTVRDANPPFRTSTASQVVTVR